MYLPISALLIASLWLAWPWLAPQLLHLALYSDTAYLLVVLDGTPRWPVPAQGMPELLQGFDAVTQITALAQWLQQQHPLTKRVWIATDPDHTARAVLNAQIALGPRGIHVSPPPPPASPGERRKLLRDALRLQLWRATGSTGAWLASELSARKRAACGL